MSDQGYLLDNQDSDAGARLRALAAIFDPWTFAHLERIGVEPAGRVWEVGAGGPSVVRWLADRVGRDGHVLATDIDVTWAGSAAGPNVEVLRHDVAAERPPEFGLDLVHARLVLVHIQARDRALASMVEGLRPGGWILVEDADPAIQPMSSVEELTPEDELANRIRLGFRSLLSGRGADLAYGRTLPRRLRDAGLRDIAADAFIPLRHPAAVALEVATVGMIGDRLIEAGIVTRQEIDRHRASVTSGRLDLAQPPLVSAWGRKPS